MLFSILLTEYSVMFPAEQLFFLFIALRLMLNPKGWCCDWLKIPELARGILSQSQYQWLVRAILHQAQGVFPGFVFLAKTRVSWCSIIYMVFRWVTRPRATCGTLRFQWKVTWAVTIRVKETRIELPPTWRCYPARLVRLERFVLKEKTHTAVPHVASHSGATWVVTADDNQKPPQSFTETEAGRKRKKCRTFARG